MDDARVQAREALIGWLETHLQEGKVPPRPAFKGKGIAVGIPAALGLKLQFRWARVDAGLTQAQLAKRLGVSQQMIAKLEHPDYEPSLSKAEVVATALGFSLAAYLAPVSPSFLPAAMVAHMANAKRKAPPKVGARR
jgi:DNA-binding XRE family transcriptional regulator